MQRKIANKRCNLVAFFLFRPIEKRSIIPVARDRKSRKVDDTPVPPAPEFSWSNRIGLHSNRISRVFYTVYFATCDDSFLVQIRLVKIERFMQSSKDFSRISNECTRQVSIIDETIEEMNIVKPACINEMQVDDKLELSTNENLSEALFVIIFLFTFSVF